MTTPPAFLEHQRFSPWFLAVILSVLVPIGGVILFSMPADAASGEQWAAVLALAVAAGLNIAIFAGFRMTTRVGDGKITFGFPLGLSRRVPLDRIEAVEVLRYRPLRDFGGWGLRIGGKGVMYNARGDRAVRLTLRGGQSVFIGSQRPEALAAALLAAR